MHTRRITRLYKATLNPDLVCMGRDDATRWWLLPAGCVVLTLAMVVWRVARGGDAEEEKVGSRRGSLTQFGTGPPYGGGHHRAF